MTPATQSPSTAALVERFARAFNALHLDRHGVASPLGLWLLLALIEPAATGAARQELDEVLGTGADEAASRAAELLAVREVLSTGATKPRAGRSTEYR